MVNYINVKSTQLSSFLLLHRYSQVTSFSYVHFRPFCWTNLNQMPFLNRYEKVTCENFDTQTTKLNLARHKKRCSAGTLYCTQCPDISTLSQCDFNFHVANKHSVQRPSIRYKCKLCHAEYTVFMLYVNTKTLNMEHKLDWELAILKWRT